MQTANFDIKKYVEILKRRWVMAASVFLVVLSVGVIYCLFWPPIYQATCLVVVQPQKVPGDIVRPTVTSKIEERLQIITQQVLSRTRLTEMIDRFELYPAMRERATPDEVAELMRKDITIKITRNNYFTITYLYTDAKTVAAVTNALASFYVDSNLRIREEDAVGTARFLARELERMRAQLREWEGRITDFKLQHLHELPEAREENLALLDQLNNRLTALESNVIATRRRLMDLESQLGTEQYRLQQVKFRAAAGQRLGESSGGVAGAASDETDPEAIKAEIQRLLVLYTPDHPDIQRLQRHLAKAESRKEAVRQEKIADAKAKGLSESEAAQLADDSEERSVRQSLERISAYIAEAKRQLADYERRQDEAHAKQEEIQARIDAAPKVTEQLAELTRGYEELNDAYQNMHAKWLEANMSANLERTQRGEQFEVVDPAEVPEQPFRPDVKRAIPFAAGLALALGLGLAFGISYLDTSFTSVEQAERMSALPVLVVVPPLQTSEEISKHKRNGAVLGLIYSLFFLALLLLLAILVTGRGPALKRFLVGLVS